MQWPPLSSGRLISLCGSLSITSSLRSATGQLVTSSLPKPTGSDPTKPIGSIKEAWEAAKLRAAKILKDSSNDKDSDGPIKPLPCRFHDLRHTAVSRMLNAGVPIAKVAKIVGWSTATMVRMAARYGHFTLDDLRGAMESISSTTIQTESPVFSPVSEVASVVTRPN